MIKKLLLTLALAHYLTYLYRSYRYAKVLVAQNTLGAWMESKFNVHVIQFIVRENDKIYALVYDPIAFAYYEMPLDHVDEAVNPFDEAIDDLLF